MSLLKPCLHGCEGGEPILLHQQLDWHYWLTWPSDSIQINSQMAGESAGHLAEFYLFAAIGFVAPLAQR